MTEPEVGASDPEVPADPGPPPTAPWQRLDPRMMLVLPVLELGKFLPLLVVLLLAGSGSGGPPWELLGVVGAVAVGLLRYLTTSFRLGADRVELRRGLLERHVLSVPLDRVRTVDLTASPVHRLLGLATIRVGTGTASSGEAERLDLDGLPDAVARGLREDLLRRRAAHQGVSDGGETGAPVGVAAPGVGPRSGEEPVVELDLAWVRFAPLTSTGLVLAGAAIGGAAQLAASLGDVRLDAEAVDMLDALPGVPLWLAVTGVVVLGVLAVSALAVAGYLVANWGFRLTRHSGAWHVRRGLLTTRETSLDEQRVAGVGLDRPITLRFAGAARLRAIVTGLDAGQPTSALLVPPAPLTVAERAGGQVLGTDRAMTAPLRRHGAAATRRRHVRAVGPALLVPALAGLAVAEGASPWWLAAGASAVAVGVLLGVDRSRSLGHLLVDGHVVARAGSLAQRREALAARHVIGWNLRATWFQRRAGLTTLVAKTAGGRQAVVVPDVPLPDALRLADEATPGLLGQFLER